MSDQFTDFIEKLEILLRDHIEKKELLEMKNPRPVRL